MSIQNLVSATLAAETKSDILKKLTEIRTQLDFLVTLDPDQIKGLFKASNGYTPFIEKAYSISMAHPEILPGFLSIEELGKDVALIEALRPILNMVNELAKGLQDTMIAANSDALGQCLEIYTAVKQYSDKVPGLASSQEELAVFFQRPSRKPAATTA